MKSTATAANFRVTTTPTGIKITATETGSVVSIKNVDGEFAREKTMETEDALLETAKERANAGYLSVFVAGFLALLGGKKNAVPVADRIKIMAEAIRLYAGCTTYRTLNNKLRQHFDNGETLTHEEFRAKFFYEGSWRYAHLRKRAAKPDAATLPAVKPATKSAILPAAAKPSKATTKAVTPAVTPATKPASKPRAKKTPVVEATDPVQDLLIQEAENVIAQDAPEAIELEVA